MAETTIWAVFVLQSKPFEVAVTFNAEEGWVIVKLDVVLQPIEVVTVTV